MKRKCDAIHHPFSMLYKLGMLGIIPTSLNREGYVTQEFLDSTKVTYITGNDLLNVNNDCIYVLHPALTKSIDKLQRKKIKHFNLFVLGKGMSVPQDKLMQLVADYRNNTIKKSDFDSKYYSKQMKKGVCIMGILSLSRKRQPMRNRLLFEDLYIDSYDLER